MLAVERRNRIEQIINKNKSVLVVELAKQFEVTTETIRGDLEKLENKACLFVHTAVQRLLITAKSNLQ